MTVTKTCYLTILSLLHLQPLTAGTITGQRNLASPLASIGWVKIIFIGLDKSREPEVLFLFVSSYHFKVYPEKTALEKISE